MCHELKSIPHHWITVVVLDGAQQDTNLMEICQLCSVLHWGPVRQALHQYSPYITQSTILQDSGVATNLSEDLSDSFPKVCLVMQRFKDAQQILEG